MTDDAGQKASQPQSLPLAAAVWPKIPAADSLSLRRRKFAVRIGHAAMAAMLAAAIGGGLVVSSLDFSLVQVLWLLLAGVGYIVWNLVGSHGLARLVLWDAGVPPPVQTRLPRCGALAYFAVQLALAAFVYLTADRGRMPNLVWLALLPPVAYAVFLLEWRGIGLVSLATMAIFVWGFCRWHDWGVVFSAATSFSFATLFTIVFTMLAVHSEKARQEVQRLAGELTLANRQLREHLVQAEDLSASRERNRIAREIHDSLGHFLTVANVQLQAARTLWSTDAARASAAVSKAQSLVQEGLQDVRRSVAALRASPLDNKSLADALRELAGSHASAEPHLEFLLLGQPRRLSSPAELSLYRAGQEGLTNLRKHSQAAHARMTLDFLKASSVALSVADDGVGADQAALASGFGLLGLRERAQLLGGELRIEAAPGKGFVLQFEVPG